MKNQKLWIAFGVVIALCLCLGIGGFFALRSVGGKMMESVKTDPAEVEQVGAKIADYTVPDGYTQQMAMSILGYDFVVIGPQEGSTGVIIMLAQFSQSFAQGADPKQFQEQMQRSFEQQSGQRGLNMKLVETKTMTIRGEEVEVNIFEGTDQNGTSSMRQLMASFPTEGGLGMVMIQGLTDDWDQDLVDSFLASIQ
jgi:hypothetical protein